MGASRGITSTTSDRYDRRLAPFTELLLEQFELILPRSLLDVGCGCGALTLAAARHLPTRWSASTSRYR